MLVFLFMYVSFLYRSIPGFSIKTTFGEPLGAPVIKTNTNLKPTRRNWFIPRKATKKFLSYTSKKNMYCESYLFRRYI